MTGCRGGLGCRNRVRSRLGLLVTVVAIGGFASLGTATAGAATGMLTYAAPGTSTFVVPDGVTAITVEAIGAAGGACVNGNIATTNGGKGASVTATLPVFGGEQLLVGVGAPGAQGCGTQTGARGGI